MAAAALTLSTSELVRARQLQRQAQAVATGIVHSAVMALAAQPAAATALEPRHRVITRSPSSDCLSSSSTTSTSSFASVPTTPRNVSSSATLRGGPRLTSASFVRGGGDVPRHREELSDDVFRPERDLSARASASVHELLRNAERTKAIDALNRRYPDLGIGTPSAVGGRDEAPTASYRAGAPPSATAAAASSHELPPLAHAYHQHHHHHHHHQLYFQPNQHQLCPRCGQFAPAWHCCLAAMPPPPPQAVVDPWEPNLHQPERRSSPVAVESRPRPIDLADATRHDGFGDDSSLRGRPDQHALPFAREPRMLRTWAIGTATASSVVSASPGAAARSLRPGMAKAQQILAQRQQRQSSPPAGLRDDEARRPRHMSSSPSPNAPSRHRDPNSPPANTSPRPSPPKSMRPAPAASQAYVVGSEDEPPQAAAPVVVAGQRLCVWCRKPRPREHDLRCGERRVMCRRCHLEVRAVDQPRHAEVCRQLRHGK